MKHTKLIKNLHELYHSVNSLRIDAILEEDEHTDSFLLSIENSIFNYIRSLKEGYNHDKKNRPRSANITSKKNK